jgi:subtilisin family serine protease
MPVYIIRPRLMASQMLSLTARALTPMKRTEQIAEVTNLRVNDPDNQEIKKWVRSTKGAELLTQSETSTPVTGTTVATMSDDQAETLKKQMDVLVLRDRPLPLIEPRRVTASSKPSLGPDDRWHLQAVGLGPAARKKLKVTGAGVTVAVLDTGVDPGHDELKGRVKGAFTFDLQSWNAVPMVPPQDTDGHGTHVSGLLAGKTVGVAPGANLYSGVMLPKGFGSLSDFILALEWASTQPDIQIINMSAGIPGFVDGMHSIVADLMAVGVLPVIATGNEGRNRTRSPGNYTEVLSVGASNRDGRVSSFSSGGILTTESHQYTVPDLVAPGEQVYSCVMGGGYEAWDGTSMATPVVSGIAALLLERYPNITVTQLVEALIDSCLDLKEKIERQGNGLVQFPQAPESVGAAPAGKKAAPKSAKPKTPKPKTPKAKTAKPKTPKAKTTKPKAGAGSVKPKGGSRRTS